MRKTADELAASRCWMRQVRAVKEWNLFYASAVPVNYKLGLFMTRYVFKTIAVK